MFIKKIIGVALFWSMGTLAMLKAQNINVKQVLTIDNEQTNLEQYKAQYQAAILAEHEPEPIESEEFDLEAYINSIDWEKEEAAILKWYEALPEDKNIIEEK